jgi:Anthrone oxygenase
MGELLEILTTLAAGTFAGAAIYINIAEHPARMTLDTAAAARQWAPSYARATLMQAPLAVLGFLAGLGAWLLGGGTGWIVAGLLLGAVVPFTLFVIMPTNRRLLEPARDLASAETRVLLGRWNKLHAVRSLLAFAAFTLAACLLAR